MQGGFFTQITATEPTLLAKEIRLGLNGLKKNTAAQFCKGNYEVKEFHTPDDVARLIAKVSTSQAITSSLPLNGTREGQIVTKAMAAANPQALTRTSHCFGFPLGVKGLIPLDYDVKDEELALSRDQLWTVLTDIFPSLKKAGAVAWSSSSSDIYNGDQKVYGVRGQRFYLMVKDISDTQRVGQILSKRLWLAGFGLIAISTSGQRLERTIFDAAMYQPARLDFIGGAKCYPPLVQKRGAPVVLNEGGWLDTREAIKDLTPAEEMQYEAKVQDAKTKAMAKANEARERWKDVAREKCLDKLKRMGVAPGEAEDRVERSLSAALGGMLLGDFEIYMADGSVATVGSILDNRDRFNGALTLDPLEPEYANRKVTGKLYLYGASPTLHSFARGGVTYRLRRQPHRIYMQRGKKAELVDEISAALAAEPDVFLRGQTLVVIEGGRMRQLRKHSLAHLIGTRTALYTKTEKGLDVAVDVPGDVVDMVIAVLEG
jgi:hypothetical protein